jgi:hypothetical protein
MRDGFVHFFFVCCLYLILKSSVVVFFFLRGLIWFGIDAVLRFSFFSDCFCDQVLYST